MLAAVCSCGFAAWTLWTLVGRARVGRFGPASPYDDEGYVMISLQSFLGGGALYDEVFTQYGPAFYVLLGAPLKLLGLAVDHELSRAVTALTWVLVPALFAWAVGRSTRSVFAATLALAFGFESTQVLWCEPLHPHGLSWVLIAVCAALGARGAPGVGRAAAWALGAACVAQALIKVNLGLYVVLGSALALSGSPPSARRARVVWWAVWCGAIAFGTWVLARHAYPPAMRLYASLVATALIGLCAVAALPGREPGPARPQLRHVLLGGAVAAALLLGALFATGTSVAGAWYGIVAQHVRLIEELDAPPFGAGAQEVQVVALLLAVLWHAAQRWPRTRAAADVVVVVLALVWACVIARWSWDQRADLVVSYGAPFLWLAVAQPTVRSSTGVAPARPWMLAGLAAFQLLQHYPVGGTHLFWTVLLYAPLAAQSMWQSAAWIRDWVAETCELPRLGLGLGYASALVLANGLRSAESDLLGRATWSHKHAPTLDLHGAASLQLPEVESARLRWLSALARQSDAWWSFPAQNGIYFLAPCAPPTRLNVTFRLDLLRPGEQLLVRSQLAAHDHLLVVTNGGGEQFLFGPNGPFGPIGAWIARNCAVRERWGEWIVRTRNGWSGPERGRARWTPLGLELATDAAITGAVAGLELVDLGSGAVLARTAGEDAERLDLSTPDGRPLDPRGAPLFDRPADVRLVPRDAERRPALEAAPLPALRLLGARRELRAVYPVVR